MSRLAPYLTRVEIETDEESDDGLLYGSGRGRAGEGPRRVLYAQQHGFASRPPAGSVGLKLTMGGHHAQPLIVGAEHPEHRPKLEAGASALYDSNGNIIRLFSGGAVFDLQNRTATFTAGGWTINGPVTINGDLEVGGNIHATGTIIDDAGNTNHHSH